jgi:hypothetical protein
MFIIVWRGLGILVPLFGVIAFVLTAGISEALRSQLGVPENIGNAVGFALTGVFAGGGLFVIASKIESKPGRVLIDAATNRQFTIRPNAGSFFFVPTKIWSYIVGMLGLIAAGANVAGALK